MSSANSNGAPVRPRSSVLRPLGQEEIRVTGGFWGGKQRTNAEATLGHCEYWMERIGWTGNFDRAAAGTIGGDHAGIEFVDSEIYKLLEAMAWELGRNRTEDLEQRYLALVARVAAAQEQDGYLHTSFGRRGQPPRYSNLEFGHELYCFGHLIQAAVARLRTGHDDTLAQVARRLADHLWVEFGPDGRNAVCGHPEIEMSLAELSRATGELRYLELARLFVERRGTGTLRPAAFAPEYFQDDIPVRDATTMRGHAVRALYLASGALDVAVDTADLGLAEAVQTQWTNAVARRTYITGGVGSHHQDEAYGDDYELPADRAYSETCAGIASVMLSWRLLLHTGDEKYADLIERTLLNNVLASPREDGQAFYYTNTLHQRTPGSVPDEHELSHRAESSLRAPWFEVSCCPTNVARTLASINLYFATATGTGIQLHQYGDYEIHTTLDDGELALHVGTDYPHGGRITVTIDTAPTTPVTIGLRIPAWARNPRIVSGHAATERGRLLEVTGIFHPGEAIRLELSLEPRIVFPDPRIDASRGTFAIERGPLVLAVESIDLPTGWSVNEITADASTIAAGPDGTSIDVYRLAEPETDWPYRTSAGVAEAGHVRARMIPYYAWANRGPATMRTWLPIHPRSEEQDA
ncbi:MAG TPA: beta-L-arabinofuranosidase domain-containing protein [Lacisediminihabitans sp.]|uniref:glycoside hydrolase family 127 protein n=1 Tax=Lacisediminihabitans sp. TaxID=2787631 RepID=UPI002ED9198C